MLNENGMSEEDVKSDYITPVLQSRGGSTKSQWRLRSDLPMVR